MMFVRSAARPVFACGLAICACAATVHAQDPLKALFTFDNGFTDLSPTNQVPMLIGTPILTQDGFEGGGLLLIGNWAMRLYIDINAAAMPKLTMGGWVREEIGTPIRHFMSHDNMGFDRNICIDYRGGGQGWSCFSGSGVNGFVPVNLKQWQFVAAVYDHAANMTTLYVDGQVKTRPGQPGLGNTYMHIGNSTCCDTGINGTIDSVFVIADALSVERLDEIYTGGVGKVPLCPTVFNSPLDTSMCSGGTLTLMADIDASGTVTHQWQVEMVAGSDVWTTLVNGLVPGTNTFAMGTDSEELVLSGLDADGAKRYRCVGSNACGSKASTPAQVSLCAGDFDCTGFLDTDDFTAFVLAFEAGDESADFDGTGFVDTDDFTAYVLAFEAGC
jgi:hypothetical protein